MFAREAESLITAERVAVTFGCWTSSGRRQVTPIVEAHQHLLFYPVQYEGLECSPFIVYTGATPNQSIVPAVTWALETLGRRVFLVGSDYVFPHTANAIIRHVTASMGGEVVGEAYAPLGSRDFGTIAASISTARPDVILNTINGDGNAAFFRALRQVGITSARIPTVSFSFAEPTIAAMGATDVVGDYSAWSHFQSLDSPENRRFIAGMRRRLGPTAAVSDPMEAAYVSVHLWARAAQEAGSTESAAVLAAIGDQSLPAPQGVVYVDAVTHHTWKAARIGRIRADGQFDVIWQSDRAARADPVAAHGVPRLSRSVLLSC